MLSLLLTEQNKNGFTSLHVEGSTNDSRTILNSAEKYIFYVGQVMVEDSSNNPGHLTYSQDNLGKLLEHHFPSERIVLAIII